MPEALHFTESQEANELIAREPLALHALEPAASAPVDRRERVERLRHTSRTARQACFDLAED